MRGAERLEVGEAPREGRGETPFEAGADMVDVVGEQYMPCVCWILGTHALLQGGLLWTLRTTDSLLQDRSLATTAPALERIGK